MPRSYRHIQEYEKEIIELKHNGYTGRQICEKFRFSKKIQECQEKCGKTYGYRRVHIWLERQGVHHNPNLVLSTIREAKKKEKVTAELQLHSDQGFQYTSQAYYRLTKSYNIMPSM